MCKLNWFSFLPSANRIVSNSLCSQFFGSLLTLLEVSTLFATLVKLCDWLGRISFLPSSGRYETCNRKSVFLPFVCWKSALLLFCYLARRTWLGLWCKFKIFEVQILPSWWRKVIIKLPRELSVTDSRNVFSLVHSEEENCRSKNFPFSIVITVECFSS